MGDNRPAAAWQRCRIPLSIACLTVVSSFDAYQPSRLYFFGDTWDILYVFQTRLGWPEAWIMHNDHFIPLSKVLLFFQYLLFGMNNFPYQVVNILILAANTVLLYVYSAEFSRRTVPRVFGALFFGVSVAHWEVTMWETGQQISLALLFLLLCLIFHNRWRRQGDLRLLGVAFLSGLCASCSMDFGLLVLPLLVVQEVSLHWPAWRSGVIRTSGLVLAILLSYAALLVSHRPHYVDPGHITSVRQIWQLLPWTVIGIRDGLVGPSSALFGPLALSGLFVIVALFFWREALSWKRFGLLAVPTAILLGSYFMTGVGRLSSGLGGGGSSRYQYLPVAGLALVVAWLAGIIFDLVQTLLPNLVWPLGVITLLTIPVHMISGYSYVRQHSPRFAWGDQAHRFVDLAIYQHSWQLVPHGEACVGPELNLPSSMYPFRFPLARAAALYAASDVFPEFCRISMGSALGNPEVQRANLLQETVLSQGSSQGNPYNGAQSILENLGPGAAREVRIELPHAGSAYGFDLQCASAREPYTFAASVKRLAGRPTACLRILSKDETGNILDTVNSPPISSPEFSDVLLSTYVAQGAATVSVDLANLEDTAEPAVIVVKKAILVQHPVYIHLPQPFAQAEGKK